MSQAIQHVSDTSFWVAHYRAIESERPDALFKDPYAHLLVGDFAEKIQSLHSETARWTQWTVVMRTKIIDQMIQDLIAQGVTTFLNIGAGLDSRPYRMNLGPNIRWIEVDFPRVIEHKTQILEKFSPTCQLERIRLDLSDRTARKSFFKELAAPHPTIAVLTEGVLPYLTVDQVSELSEDLTQFASFKYWIGEYISPKSYRYLQNPKRMDMLRKSPFQFYPEDWMGFFQSRGWKLNQEKYYIDLAEQMGRATPLPKFFKVLEFLFGKKWALPFKRMSGYLLWERK